jgi:hypothetical protein
MRLVRDQHGRINPHQLATALLEFHQAATAGEIADQLIATPAGLTPPATPWLRATRYVTRNGDRRR